MPAQLATSNGTAAKVVTVEHRVELLETTVGAKLDRLMDKQTEMANDMKSAHGKFGAKLDKIDTALYDPETGLYAKIKNVENIAVPAKKSRDKVFWMVVSGVVGVIVTTVMGIVLAGVIG